MWVTKKVEISEADYKDLFTNQLKIDEYVSWRAKFSTYPPAGYGFSKPRVFIEDNRYYCSWNHRDNCD